MLGKKDAARTVAEAEADVQAAAAELQEASQAAGAAVEIGAAPVVEASSGGSAPVSSPAAAAPAAVAPASAPGLVVAPADQPAFVAQFAPQGGHQARYLAGELAKLLPPGIPRFLGMFASNANRAAMQTALGVASTGGAGGAVAPIDPSRPFGPNDTRPAGWKPGIYAGLPPWHPEHKDNLAAAAAALAAAATKDVTPSA